MIIQKYTHFIMRGRMNAALMALLWAIVPLMGWLSVVTMALVTLRKGALDGLFVLVWAMLPGIALAFLGHPTMLIYGVLCGSLVTWILAITLRETMSWSLTILVACFIGICGVLLAHGLVGNLAQVWHRMLTEYYSNAQSTFKLQLSAKELQTGIQIMAKIATGVQAVFILLVNLANLLIARGVQAHVFNPGGLAQELRAVRLNKVSSGLLVLVLLFAFGGISVAWDVLPVVLFLFFLAGLSLVHALAKVKQSNMTWLWLSVFYVALIIFFVYIASFVIIAAIVDSWLNIRKRVTARVA